MWKRLYFKVALILSLVHLFNPTDTYGQYSQNTDSAKYARFLPDYV